MQTFVDHPVGGHIISALIGVAAFKLLVNNIPETRRYPEIWF